MAAKTISAKTQKLAETKAVEDEDEVDSNLQKILAKFKENSEFYELGNTEQYLIETFQTESHICLICIDSVGVKDPIWNCEGCFAQFHINCIQNWIKDGSYLVAASANNLNKDINQKDIPWNCPKCRREYQQKSYPTYYYCYCKKVRDPKHDPWSVPHSCNQRCEKLKSCGHSCKTLCHPGPCPPCPVMVMNSCHCGKSDQVSRRCSNKHWSCNKVCNKLLGCKQHLCPTICHANACTPCAKTSIQFCKCKKQRKEISCTTPVWQCEQKCGKDYSCGFHKCEVVCHPSGECGECPKSLKRSCPCGKSKFQKPCTEDIPTCGDTCEKPLNCGMHKCYRRCHFGDCDQCREIVKKKCRCGKKEKEMPCCEEFKCENKCTKTRNCGNHKCGRKCCDGSCPPCEQICNKPLSCKNHKCSSYCHSGPCYPCTLSAEISCTCGSSKIKVPCVKSKAEIRVPCKELCKLPPKCHHEKIQQHRCHYGLCPACNLKCGKQLQPCNHICNATCHSAVLTEIIENKDRDGPWVPINVRKEFVNKKCGDCVEPILVTCLGDHEKSHLPCHRARPYNCGRKCGQTLKCTHHTCELECHSLKAQVCLECESPCEQPRPTGCEHECSKGLCHPGKCPSCAKLIKMKCHCAENFVYAECNKWNGQSKAEQDQLKSCKVPCTKTIACGHSCTLICHPGAHSGVDNCQEKVVLRCPCRTLRKSIQCNQVRNEPDLVEEKSKSNQEPKKYLLKCNDKCAERKRLQKEKEAGQIEAEEKPAESPVNSSKNVYIIAAIVCLIISILVYFLL